MSSLIRPVRINVWDLNYEYNAACWEWLHSLPISAWDDFNNTFDGCAFE